MISCELTNIIFQSITLLATEEGRGLRANLAQGGVGLCGFEADTFEVRSFVSTVEFVTVRFYGESF